MLDISEQGRESKDIKSIEASCYKVIFNCIFSHLKLSDDTPFVSAILVAKGKSLKLLDMEGKE